MRRILLIFLFAAAFAAAAPAAAEPVSSERPAEYMIYQYANISLVVKIDVPESGFIASITGPDDSQIVSAGIPGERIGPIFQYIAPSDIPRQLMIEVKPSRAIDRSRISLELIQLSGRDRLSEVSAQAYQLFSQGTSLAHSNDTSTWAMKAYTLRNAAQAFADLGWEEMRLWSEFYAGHLALVRLNDLAAAMEFARGIQAQARRAGFLKIELAATILEADALQMAGSTATGRVAAARLEQAHGVLQRVAALAGRLGMRSEQARAFFNNGLVYQKQDQLDAAVRQFQAALDVSLDSDDLELVNEIRSTAAAVYETQGATSGAIEMLEDIGSDLKSDADSSEDLTATLFEKGRIFNSSYRFPEASAELSATLALQREDPSSTQWGPTGLALAWSLYAMGDFIGAADLIQESIPRTPARGNAAALLRAYESLANIYRELRQFQLMDLYRGKQGELSRSDEARARFLFESGRDARHKDGSRSAEARDKLAQSRRIAAAAGEELLAARAAMKHCLLRLEAEGRGACSLDSVRAAYDALKLSGIPNHAVDAELNRAGILLREGRHGEAHAAVQELLREVLFLRQTLPGVIGAWYWINRSAMLQVYMDIALARAGVVSGGTGDGRQVLQALDQVRQIRDADARVSGRGAIDVESDEAVRSLLARRATSGPPESAELTTEVNRALGRLKQGYQPAVVPMSGQALDELLAGLNRDESILAYYFGESIELALLCGNEGVRMARLPDRGGSAGRRLVAARERIADGGASLLAELDALGRQLVGPVAGRLARNIYLLPSGALNGFPFDLIRLDGVFIARRHRVTNLASLGSVANRESVLAPDIDQGVFLAGNPRVEQDLFSYDLPVSSEIATLTDRFVGPGLHIIQGVALRRDEFQDPRFLQAGLVHLAMPGSIDLAWPGSSVLEMSGSGPVGSPGGLGPRDIVSLNLTAGLVVMSQTAVTGTGRTGLDSRLGLVSDFLDAGARVVVASLWPEDEAETATFMNEFYGRLEAGPNVPEALYETRMEWIESADDANFKSWARFQLFIR